jgi:hypothetical protein
MPATHAELDGRYRAPRPGLLLTEGYNRETFPPLLSKNDASTIRPEFGTPMIAKFFIQSVLVTGVLS